MEIKNAVIVSTQLTIKDHGLLSGWIQLDYGGSQQGFGGLALYLPKGFKHHQKTSHAGHWIYRILEVAGVESWDQLKGKTVRVRCDFSHIAAIGHIVKEDWFNPKDDFELGGPNV